MEGGDSEFANFTSPKTHSPPPPPPLSLSLSQIRDLLVSQKIDSKTLFFFFSTLRPLFPVVSATATVVAFVLLRNSRFNFLCYTQRGPEVTLRPLATSCAKNYKGYSLVANQLHRTSQQGHPLTTSSLAGAGARSRHAGRMFCVLWLPSSPQPHT